MLLFHARGLIVTPLLFPFGKSSISFDLRLGVGSPLNTEMRSRNVECESELVELLQNPMLLDDDQIDSYVLKKRELDLDLKHLRTIEDQCWHQKFHIRWLKESDLNTFFFLKVASSRRRVNLITPAMITSLINTDVISVKAAFTEVFKDRFGQSARPQLLDWSAFFPTLDINHTSALEIPFSKEKIFQSLKDANSDKAPCPDGFSFRFAQSF